MEHGHGGRGGGGGLRDSFVELNQCFMSSCIENLETLGSGCCLAPLAADYLSHCFMLLNEADSVDGVISPKLLDIGSRLQQLLNSNTATFSVAKGKRTGNFSKVITEPMDEQPEISDPVSICDVKESRVAAPIPFLDTQPQLKFFPIVNHTSKTPEVVLFSSENDDPPRESEPKGTTLRILNKEFTSSEPPVTSNGFVLGNNGSTFSVSPHVFNGFSAAPILTSATSSAPVSSQPDEDEDERKEKEAQSHEFVPVTEGDAVFSIRCKLFHKPSTKDKFEVRGLGMLYVQAAEKGRHRILVRADNNLGTILLNMFLDKDLPVRLEKKQIITVDPHAPCPITILVKSEADAERLFKIIETHKNNVSSPVSN